MSQFFNQTLDNGVKLHYNFDTQTAIATVENPETGSTAKAVFRNFSIARMSYLKSFKEHIKDCLEWSILWAGYKTITLDPEATNVPVMQAEVIVL